MLKFPTASRAALDTAPPPTYVLGMSHRLSRFAAAAGCLLVCVPALAQTTMPPRGQPPAAPQPPGNGLHINRPGEQPHMIRPFGNGYLATRPGELPKRCTPIGNGRLACN